jgi:hypothetical protein
MPVSNFGRFGSALERLSGREASFGGMRVPARIERAALDGVALAYAKATVECAEVRRVEKVTAEAMHATGQLAQMEGFWGARVPPHVAARFQALAESAAINMLDIVNDTRM